MAAFGLVLLAYFARGSRELEIANGALHGTDLELRLGDLVWVDVVCVTDRQDLSNANGALVAVVAKSRDGLEHVLAEPVQQDVALRICRAIESAMMDAENLELANRAKVRVAIDEEAVVPAEPDERAAV